MNLALKIRTDARRQIPKEKRDEKKRDEKKQRQAALFKRRYDKPKVIKFKTMGKVSKIKHFNFPKLSNKSVPIESQWSFGKKAPLSAKAVYPVICSLVDFNDYNKWHQISQKNIAKLAGIAINTAKKGIEHLVETPYALTKVKADGERLTHYLVEQQLETDGERQYYVYRAGFVRGDMMRNNDFFKFPTWIIDTGVWAKLKHRSKALYIALRSCSRFDKEIYAELEFDVPFDDLDDVEFDDEQYKNRKWEVCDTPTKQLCDMVDINSSDIRKIVDDLEASGLVEKVNKMYKVWLQPNPDKDTITGKKLEKTP